MLRSKIIFFPTPSEPCRFEAVVPKCNCAGFADTYKSRVAAAGSWVRYRTRAGLHSHSLYDSLHIALSTHIGLRNTRISTPSHDITRYPKTLHRHVSTALYLAPPPPQHLCAAHQRATNLFSRGGPHPRPPRHQRDIHLLLPIGRQREMWKLQLGQRQYRGVIAGTLQRREPMRQDDQGLCAGGTRSGAVGECDCRRPVYGLRVQPSGSGGGAVELPRKWPHGHGGFEYCVGVEVVDDRPGRATNFLFVYLYLFGGCHRFCVFLWFQNAGRSLINWGRGYEQ